MKRRSRKQLQRECDEWAEIAYIKTRHIQELEDKIELLQEDLYCWKQLATESK